MTGRFLMTVAIGFLYGTGVTRTPFGNRWSIWQV
jgi:hypothetical protein